MVDQPLPAQPQGEPSQFKGGDIYDWKKNFVSHPPNQGVSTQPLQGQQQGQQSGSPPTPSPRFKSFPIKKILFLGIVFLIFLTSLALLVSKFRPEPPRFFGKKGEIVWWGINDEEAVVAGLIQEFQEKNPDIKITYLKQSPKDYRERLANSLVSGKGPDIFEFHNTWVPMFRQELSTLPQEIMNQTEYSQTFYPVIVSDLLTNRGIVGIPLFYDAITLFVNQDIFSSSASEPPRTWNELSLLVDPLKGRLTLRDRDGLIIRSGVALGNTENVDFWEDILALMIIQNKGNPEEISSSRVLDTIDFYKQFSFSNTPVWDETLPPSTIAFAQGKVAMYFGPSRKAYEIAKSNKDLRFRTVKLPQIPKDNPQDPDVSYANYWVQGVWEKSANKDTAWKFLKFLSGKDSIVKLNQARKSRLGFELLSPRVDMIQDYLQDPILGSVASLAFSARSWYLADETFDGERGINTRLSRVFERLLMVERRNKEEVAQVEQDFINVLVQFGLRRMPSPTPKK